MDITTFNRAKQAYDARNWESAVVLFSQCGTGAGTGEACHLCGNALMRIGRVQEATQAYRAALADSQYRNQGAVYTNLGKAQMALGDLRGAIDSLRHALEDTSYRGAYKAHTALGEAYGKLGDPRNAGTCYRQAALDANNPEPAKSLINLGVCFMQMRRPADAAEAYRTAVDFAADEAERSVVLANLGQAYVASNRMPEAVQAFQSATANGYPISPAAKVDYDRALQAVQALGARTGFTGQSSDGLFGASGSFDLDGSMGGALPSPDASGFFSIDEAALTPMADKGVYEEKPVSKVLKVIVIVLLVIALAIGAVAGVVFSGFGIPTREGAVQSLFAAAQTGASGEDVWSSSVSSAARSQVMASIESTGSATVIGMDATPTECVAIVQASLPQGGKMTYRVSMIREGIGWKVSNVERVLSSLSDDTFTSAFAGTQTVAEDATEAAAQTADQAVAA